MASCDDFDEDGKVDIWLGGNFYGLKPQAGRHNASKGVFLKNVTGNLFEFLPPAQTGIIVPGEVRDAIEINKMLLVARNNQSMMIFKRK